LDFLRLKLDVYWAIEGPEKAPSGTFGQFVDLDASGGLFHAGLSTGV
jgi:hypothetical protein